MLNQSRTFLHRRSFLCRMLAATAKIIAVALILIQTGCDGAAVRKSPNALPGAITFRFVSGNGEPDTITSPFRNGDTALPLAGKALLDLSDIAEAQVIRGESGDYAVRLTMTDAGREKFRTLTGENVGKRLAILFHDQILTAPFIQEQIPDGRAEIHSRCTLPQAEALAREIMGAEDR